MLYINIEPPSSEKKESLIDGISDLRNNKNSMSHISSIAKLDNSLKPKKERKKKKKKKKEEKSSIASLLTDDDKEIISSVDMDNLDVDDDIMVLLAEADSDITKSLIAEGKNYKKYKNSDNDFEKIFAKELTMLYDLLDESDEFSKKLMKQFDSILGSKSRGMSKTTTDLMSNIISSKKSKLDVIKEIASIKKNIQELKFKNEDRAKKSETGAEILTNENAAAMFMQNMMKIGRNNFIKAIDTEDYGVNDLALSKAMNQFSSSDVNDGWYDGYYTNGELDNVDDMIDYRLNESDYYGRTEDGDKYIMYESQNVKIVIKKCVETGEWEFIAVDENNQEVVGYPLPTVKGKLKFSSDGSYATDKYGRSYKVLEYYTDEDY